MPVCKKCHKTFPNVVIVNGAKKIIHKRRNCLKCNPFGSRLKSSLIERNGKIYKKCRGCGETKLISQFHELRQQRSYKSKCKDCLRGSSTEWARQRKQRIVAYLGNRCQDCKKSFPYYVYDCHHLEAKEKSFQVSLEKIKWELLLPELDKCILLCSNCHRIRHFQES